MVFQNRKRFQRKTKTKEEKRKKFNISRSEKKNAFQLSELREKCLNDKCFFKGK